MPKEPQGRTITSVERATDVLALFADAEDQQLGVTEIAQALNLSKAVVHRILASFRAKGFVEYDEATRRYALGPRVLHLGLAYMSRIDIRAAARPVLESLSRATKETAALSLRVGSMRLLVDQVSPERDVRMVMHLGQEVPLHAGASSKAFLAFLNAEEQKGYLAGRLDKLTTNTITNPRSLRKELREIRDRGYAISNGERMEGAASVAAPVFDHDGAPAAVLSVSGPAERFRAEVDEAAKLLLEATDRMSRELGYRPERRKVGAVDVLRDVHADQ